MRIRQWLVGGIIILFLGATLTPRNDKAQGQQPTTWPDMIIQVWDGEQWQFQRVSSDGTTTDLLIDAPEFLYINFLTYSPDHQWLYFGGALEEDNPPSFEPVSIEGLARRIYRIPITGGKPEVIIDTAVEGSTVCYLDSTCYESVRLTPDGQYFVYIPDKRRSDGWRGIWRIRSDGTENTEISAVLNGSHISPHAWFLSSNGEWVYFNLVEGYGSEETTTDTIYRARLNGNPQPEKIIQVSRFGVWHVTGDWVVSYLPDDTPLYAISLITNDQIELVQASKSYISLYHAFPEQDIVILQGNTRESLYPTSFAVRLSDGTPLWEFAGEIQAVINDEWVILKPGRFDSTTPLTRMRLDGTGRTELEGGQFPFVSRISVAGDWLVAGNGDSQESSIRAVNWQTGEERLLWQTDIPDTFLAYPVAVSPDGAWVVVQVTLFLPGSIMQYQLIALAPDGHAAPTIIVPQSDVSTLDPFVAWFPE